MEKKETEKRVPANVKKIEQIEQRVDELVDETIEQCPCCFER